MAAAEPLFVGIEIGGTKVQVACGDGRGKIRRLWRGVVEPRDGAAGVLRQVAHGVREVVGGRKPLAVGIGFGGPVSWRTGRVCKSHHVEGWDGYPLAAWLRRQMGAPVFLENDANVAALGEAVAGAGRRKGLVFYMTVGSGIGGGLVVEGEIFHGAEPGEMEIGHTRIPVRGRPASRWPILETLASGWSVDRRVRAAILRRPRSLLARLATKCGEGGARILWPAVRDGDIVAGRIWEEATDGLALALSHVVHLAHPKVLVLGGGLSLIGEPLRRAIEVKMGALVMAAHAGTWKLRVSVLGERVVPTGALLLAARRLVESPPTPRLRRARRLPRMC